MVGEEIWELFPTISPLQWLCFSYHRVIISNCTLSLSQTDQPYPILLESQTYTSDYHACSDWSSRCSCIGWALGGWRKSWSQLLCSAPLKIAFLESGNNIIWFSLLHFHSSSMSINTLQARFRHWGMETNQASPSYLAPHLPTYIPTNKRLSELSKASFVQLHLMHISAMFMLMLIHSARD